MTTTIRCGRVDPGVAERLLEGAPLAVGLHGAAGLAGHDHDRLVEPVLQGGAHEVGVRGVQHVELDAGRRADHLGRERRAAHPAQHDAGQTLLAQLHLERRDVGRPAPARSATATPTPAACRPPPRRPGPTGWRPGARSGRRRRRPPAPRPPRRTPPRRRTRRRARTTPPRPRSRPAELTTGLLHLALDGLDQLVPRLLELVDALGLQDDQHVVEVDADLAQPRRGSRDPRRPCRSPRRRGPRRGRRTPPSSSRASCSRSRGRRGRVTYMVSS